MPGYMLRYMNIDALVLMHQAIRIHSANQIFIIIGFEIII